MKKEIIEKLNWRYSTKVFDKEKNISKTDLDTILESFRLTASSFWLQPWKIVVVEDKKLREFLVEHSWWQRQVVDSSYLLVLCRLKDIWDDLVDSYIDSIISARWVTKDSLKWYENMMKWFLWKLSDHEKSIWAEKQLFIALWNMMSACAMIWIDSCPMEWFSKEKYDEILWLKDMWLNSVVLLPVWYRSVDDNYSKLKKVRFAKKDIIKYL